jgi:RNA polymerase sigma-70 factor (ECF subfamily)
MEAAVTDSGHDREGPIRAIFELGDYDASATMVVSMYGSEILGFLVTRSPSYDDACEIFAQFSEDFWKGWPKFEWRCSARTWAYKLARHAAFHYRERQGRGGQAVPLSRASQLSKVIEQVRTQTRDHLRTEVKNRFQQLREQLAPEDQTLLILRVDRGMSWRELAEIMLDSDHNPDDDTIKREAARLRKRFQVAKETLRKLATQEGLIGAGD